MTLAALLLAPQTLQLNLPPRPPDAVLGSQFAQQIGPLPQKEREQRIFTEITAGNVPDFLRHLVPVPITSGRIFVTPDYLAVGSNDDYLLVPMTPYTAQRIADRTRCILPTPKIVDEIAQAAQVKLEPSPIPPSQAMTTVPVFLDHNRIVARQRSGAGPLGVLVAGDKKDIVICQALPDNPGKVAIYGWHHPNGKPIQPLFLGHFAYWADYSHGVRLVARTMEIDQHPTKIDRVLADPNLSRLLSDEGPLTTTRYRFTVFPQPDDPTIHPPPGEQIETFAPTSGVRVLIDEPKTLLPKLRLVLYALPNGNTIEQTFGRQKRPDDDWHYDIQHIGAQTRFLRQTDKDESLVVAYIEAANHSWPSWLHAHDPNVTTQIVDAITARYLGKDIKIVLDSHSGGGAFMFDYLAAQPQIPPTIDRIALLDSEYNYETAVHEPKLAQWLNAPNNHLCVIAYDDADALYKGKPFVSAEGGTWGRSHAMLTDLGMEFKIDRTNTTDPERYEGLSGRIVFLLKENPKKEIFHTVQVERNGFIEGLLSGTDREGIRYRYFGPRAYSRFICR